MVDVLRQLHGVDGQFDIHVALHLPAPGSIDEFPGGRLGNDRVAVVVQPIDQGPYRRVFLILDDRGVVVRPDQRPPALKFPEQALVINIEAKRTFTVAKRLAPSINSASLSDRNDIGINSWGREPQGLE